MKDIKKALRMRYIAKISLRDTATAVKLPHSTIADYCKRFDKSGYDLDELLTYTDEKIFSILFDNSIKVPKNNSNEKPMSNEVLNWAVEKS